MPRFAALAAGLSRTSGWGPISQRGANSDLNTFGGCIAPGTGRKRKSEAIVLLCASRKKARPIRFPQLAIEQENRNHWTFDPVQKSRTEFPVAVESCWQDQVLWARLAIASPYSTGTYTTSLALSHFALSGHSSPRCFLCAYS